MVLIADKQEILEENMLDQKQSFLINEKFSIVTRGKAKNQLKSQLNLQLCVQKGRNLFRNRIL